MTPIHADRSQANDHHADDYHANGNEPDEPIGHGPSNLAPGEPATRRRDPSERHATVQNDSRSAVAGYGPAVVGDRGDPRRSPHASDQPTNATTGNRSEPRSAPRAASPANRRLAAALVYARRGWRVFPVVGVRPDGRCLCGRPDCASPGKHPLLREWPRLATTDPKTIFDWWRRFPLANVAIATGRASGLVVLDVDPRHGGDESLAQLAADLGGLPTTPIVQTGGGGWHLYFAHPGGNVANASAVGGRPGLDLRGDGGYVVAPPSAHASGQAYAWDPRTPKGGVLAKLPDLTPPTPLPRGGRGRRGFRRVAGIGMPPGGRSC